MQVREEDEAFAESPELLLQRLLDLEHEVGAIPDLLDSGGRGADCFVGGVGERAPFAGPALDDDFVPFLHQFACARRRQRDAVFIGLDLLDDADFHRAGRLSHREYVDARRPAAKAVAKNRGSSSALRPMGAGGTPWHASRQSATSTGVWLPRPSGASRSAGQPTSTSP